MGNESVANRLEIAKRIKNARKNAGLTQGFVAKQLNLTPQAISNYERGKNNVPVSILFEMADLYGLKEFFFLDSLPESYNMFQASIGEVQYCDFEYELEINNELANASEFERRNIIQKKIRDLSPNDVELFIAEKMQYGSRPDFSNVPVTSDEIESVCIMLDALLYAAINDGSSRYQNEHHKISKLIVLLQANDKVKNGYNFVNEELLGTIHPGTNPSEFIKKYAPDNPPEDDYITVEHTDNGNHILTLHETPKNSAKKKE